MTFGTKTTTSTSIYPQHLPEEWAWKLSRAALPPIEPPSSPANTLWTVLTGEPCTLALPVCSDPQVFISCPVPTQIIHKVKCCLPFRVVTNLSTLSLSSVIPIDTNEETNMCVTEQRQPKINEKKCGHQKPIIHSKLYRGNHQSVEIKWEGKCTKTTHLDWGKKGGCRDEVASTYTQSQPHGKEYKYLDMNRPLKIQLQSLLAHRQTYNKPTNVETQIR